MATDRTSHSEQPKRGENALLALVFGLLGGWLFIAIYALANSGFASVLGVASMVAASSMLVGAFLGFLFGVPRTLQENQEPETPTASIPKTDASDKQKSSYRPNTNLEQISDWLTKILVGAGLTQIGAIRNWLNSVSASLAPGFGGGESGRIFALATVLYYLFAGFLIGYLWTRLYLAGAMQQADVENLARRIDKIKEQNDLDAKALALVIRQLNPSADNLSPSQEELNEVISQASQNFKAQIFYQAATIRQDNWTEPRSKGKMERTIPIFRALIASDKDEAFHRNYGQLGYALKDQRAPDWRAAEAALTKAIQIRGSGLDHDWLLYEFNRALCWIATDENFKNNEASSPESRKRILDELKIACSKSFVRGVTLQNEISSKWLRLNNIVEADLKL